MKDLQKQDKISFAYEHRVDFARFSLSCTLQVLTFAKSKQKVHKMEPPLPGGTPSGQGKVSPHETVPFNRGNKYKGLYGFSGQFQDKHLCSQKGGIP